jgi:membrane protease YdiL (CAAX protease family)
MLKRSSRSARSNKDTLKKTFNTKLVVLYFVYLYIAWFAAWYMHRHLWAPENWLDSSMGTFWYWVVLKTVLWIAPALWLIKKSGKTVSEFMGFRTIREATMWGAGLGVLLMITVFITKASQNEPYLSVYFGPAFWSSVILAPFAETLVFRGIAFQTLRSKVGFWTTNIVCAFLALATYIPGWFFQERLMVQLTRPFQGAISIILLGLVFGYAVEKSKSATGGWIAQALNNYANL